MRDPNFTHTPYNEYLAYGRSKTATILLAVELDRRLCANGIRATALHPGAIQIETVQKIIDFSWKWKEAGLHPSSGKTFPKGAATTVWAVIVAPVSEVAARYCEDCHVADIVDDAKSHTGVRSYALNAETAKALSALAEEMVGERSPSWTNEQVESNEECCTFLVDGIRVLVLEELCWSRDVTYRH